MTFQPQDTSRNGRIDAQLFPPRHFITTPVNLSMMAATQGHWNSSLTLRPSAIRA
jgi:hypothetical protein